MLKNRSDGCKGRLCPIRIDASSDDGSFHLIDTLLIDTTCLPIQMTVPNSSSSSSPLTIFQKYISDNAEFLTTSLLADMNVNNVSKFNKAGRLKLEAATGLKDQILEQIRCQLELMFQIERGEYKNNLQIRNTDVQVHDDDDIIQKDHEQESCENNNQKISLLKTEDSKSLIPIHIRIRENNIVVSDEFFIDPNDTQTNPLLIASTIVQDLNLPDSMTNSIAIHIAEQILGLDVNADVHGMKRQYYDSTLPSNSSSNFDHNSSQTARINPNSLSIKQQAINCTYATSTIPNKSPSQNATHMLVERNVPTAWQVDEKDEQFAQSQYVTFLS